MLCCPHQIAKERFFMKNKKIISILLAGAMCIGVLTACSSTQPGTPASNNPTTSQQVSGKPGASQQLSDETGGELVSEFVGPSLGEFTTQDVNGSEYTQDMFKEYDLTLVNIFTTWCTPCVAEMPELEKLYQQMKDQGVNVVGFVLDVLNEKGEIVQTDLERAQELVEKTGVTYPVLLPDSGYLNGRLTGIEAFPETFFVDRNGNVVGGTYQGSGGLEDWLEVVEQELADLKGGTV